MGDGWDFTKLPKEEHAAIIQAYAENDARKLLEIHDKYKLSPHKYCCNCTVTMPEDIAKNLLKAGVIESNGEDKKMSFIVYFGDKNWCTVWVDTMPKHEFKTQINISFS